MPKLHRGKTLWKLPAHGRGTCPVCGRTRVKLLYPLVVNGKATDVCKSCRSRSAS